jgi:predicted RecB family nuclease
MQFSGSDFYRAYRPSECDMRLYLHHQGVQAADPGPYEEVIRRLGDRHERAYLATFADVVDLSQGTHEERRIATLNAIQAGAAVIYQPLFAATVELAGQSCDLVGSPDFLIREDENYIVRDVKMTRRITEKDHPEILWQLRLYGWLFELAVGRAPLRLEVFNGKSELVTVDPVAPREQLARIAEVVTAGAAPFEPVGWTRCGGCGYNAKCWSEAVAQNDVALVLKVDKGLARALRSANVVSYDDLLTQFDEPRLSALEKPWGKKTQKVGKAAKDILLSARALQSKQPIALAPPILPESSNFVMFDLEGLPPHLDELDKIYLWGLQVYGEKPSAFTAATAGFGPDGDRQGWYDFLAYAEAIMTSYGNIPFVHWSHYEGTKIKLYVDRHGDPNGIAAAVLANLFDLLPATQNSVMLPLPSYSLKVVEEYVGFERTQDEYGGAWSMAQYIEATETDDEATRQKLMNEILKYNEEDLAATWAVLSWVKEFGTKAVQTSIIIPTGDRLDAFAR